MLSELEIKNQLSKSVKEFPESVVILGSGWNHLLKEVTIENEISYETLFGVKASIPGHDGKFIIANIQGKRVGFMSGRFHIYEGYSSEEVTLPIKIFAGAGMKKLIVTSASGAINEKYEVGDFIILSDVITLLLKSSPLKGSQFCDLSQIFDTDMKQNAIKICVKNNINFHEGVYCYTPGPHFETPADKMMLKMLGADVVGMSSVPEIIMAKFLGIKTLGLSFITNLAFVKHEHKEVLAEAEKVSLKMSNLLKELLS